MHAKSLQSCLTLRDPMDSSPPGSSNHRILQARILEWVAISFSIKNVWQVQKQNQKSCVAYTQGKWRKNVKALNATLQNVDFVSTANGKTAKTFSEQGKWSNMCSWTVKWSCNTGLRKYCAQSLNHVWLFATPWTVVCQAPLSMGILQATMLEWIAMTFSRGSSQPRDHTHISYVSCTGR